MKKVLIIDDARWVRDNFERAGEVMEIEIETPSSIKDIEERLRNIPYAAILLDHDLEDQSFDLRVDPSVFCNPSNLNGKQLHDGIRAGRYGKINRQTPIYSISDSFRDYGLSLTCKGGDALEYVKALEQVVATP